jgi:hypothetical protein
MGVGIQTSGDCGYVLFVKLVYSHSIVIIYISKTFHNSLWKYQAIHIRDLS